MKPGTRYGELPKHLRRYRDDIFDDKYNRLSWNDVSRSITAHLAKDGYWYIHPSEQRTLDSARSGKDPDLSGPFPIRRHAQPRLPADRQRGARSACGSDRVRDCRRGPKSSDADREARVSSARADPGGSAQVGSSRFEEGALAPSGTPLAGTCGCLSWRPGWRARRDGCGVSQAISVPHACCVRGDHQRSEAAIGDTSRLPPRPRAHGTCRCERQDTRGPMGDGQPPLPWVNQTTRSSGRSGWARTGFSHQPPC